MKLRSFGTRRVRQILSITTRVGEVILSKGGGGSCLGKGSVIAMFSRTSAEAHDSFRLTNGCLKTSIVGVAGDNDSVAGNRDLHSALLAISTVKASIIVVHGSSRKTTLFTSGTGDPGMGAPLVFGTNSKTRRRPDRALLRLFALHRTKGGVGRVGCTVVKSVLRSHITEDSVCKFAGLNTRIRLAKPHALIPGGLRTVKIVISSGLRSTLGSTSTVGVLHVRLRETTNNFFPAAHRCTHL